MISTYSSRNVIMVIRSRMRWAVYVARKGKHEGKNRFEGVHADGKIILKWILKKQDGRAWIASIWLTISGRLL